MEVHMRKFVVVFFTVILVGLLWGCRAKVQYKDGTYQKESENSGYGYEKVIVVIEKGKIKSVDLQRLDSEGKEVDYDEWDGSNNRPNLKEYRIQLAEEIMEKQSTKDVEAISGATYTTQNWINLVEECLKEARK